jgi:putative ABC transport system permease protein
MKYFPLVWAALRRKPVRLILTLLSIVVAFSLFGMMTGFKASLDHFADVARGDRIFVNSRFAAGLPESLGSQLSALPGVKYVAPMGFVGGFYQTPRSPAFVMMADKNMALVWPELGLTPQQYGRLTADPSGIFISRGMLQRLRLTLKPGDNFPIQVPGIPRADGSKTWTFKILEVVADQPDNPGGYMLGNLKYLDEARPASARGTGVSYRIIIADPTRGDATAKLIDQTFANSGTPTRSISEKTAAGNATSGGGGIDFPFVMESIAGAGLFMILFLTGNSIAQSVRERIPEFAALKTIGFSDRGVMALVFAEAAVPCLVGAGLGMALATLVAHNFTKMLPPNVGFPAPYMSAPVYLLALGCAVLVAFVSAVLPAARIARLDVAAALSGRT